MNEKIEYGKDMFKVTQDVPSVIKTIMNNSLKTRKKTEVSYRPYKKIDGIGFEKFLSWQNVDFNIIHPESKNGDSAFIEFDILCSQDEEIFLNVSFNTDVYYNGEKVYSKTADEDASKDMEHILITVKKNEANNVRIYCTKHNEKFSFRFLISVQRYPFMWANDYLFYARNILPGTQECYEEGVRLSALIRGNADDESYLSINEKAEIPCDGIYYIYTECMENDIIFTNTFDKLCINGKEITDESVLLHENDRIVAVSSNLAEDASRFKDTCYGLSFLSSNRKNQLNFMFAGPFGSELKDIQAENINQETVFTTDAGDKIFWTFPDGSDLRIYLDSVFYGQWFYALMVGFYGIRTVGELCGDKEAERYFCENMQAMAKYFDYVKYELEKYRMPTFMPRIGDMAVLDNIGTMGMNFVDAYIKEKDSAILTVIDSISDNMLNSVPRFPDGTFFRIDTMWADDLYMSCPFLVRMGKLTGDKVWFERAIEQVLGFKKRLYMEDKQLFSHIYFTDTQCANRVPWGRGNGWVMWTLSEILIHAGETVDTSEIKKLFSDMAHSLKKYQTECGLWRQVLDSDAEGSYIETSCTGMFMLALSRGMKHGWLDDSFMEVVDRAWLGLLENSIDADGHVYGVCMGSGCSMEKEYYYTIPTIINDDHGTGVILTAAAEYNSIKERGI